MLKTANSSKNLLTSIDITEKDEIMGSGSSNRTNKNLSKSQKQKNSTVLSNISANAKDTGFLTYEASIVFT